jgi:hypothetical protein
MAWNSTPPIGQVRDRMVCNATSVLSPTFIKVRLIVYFCCFCGPISRSASCGAVSTPAIYQQQQRWKCSSERVVCSL